MAASADRNDAIDSPTEYLHKENPHSLVLSFRGSLFTLHINRITTPSIAPA